MPHRWLRVPRLPVRFHLGSQGESKAIVGGFQGNAPRSSGPIRWVAPLMVVVCYA